MPLASKNHRGANMESSERVRRALISIIVNPGTRFEFQNIFRAPYHRRRARLSGQTRVYDDSMTKPAAWGWMVLAGILYAVSSPAPVSYTHLRAHETRHDLVCRL